jgi:hypothetical protein
MKLSRFRRVIWWFRRSRRGPSVVRAWPGSLSTGQVEVRVDSGRNRAPAADGDRCLGGANCATRSTVNLLGGSEMSGASRQKVVRFSNRTNSAAHSRASGIFPASLKARAFARAWLSADRSAADSFPGRAPVAPRAAADMLRIATGPTRFQRVINLDVRRFDRNVYPSRQRCVPAARPPFVLCGLAVRHARERAQL